MAAWPPPLLEVELSELTAEPLGAAAAGHAVHARPSQDRNLASHEQRAQDGKLSAGGLGRSEC